MTPLDASRGVMTPSGLHFERHHGGIPNIDPASHSLIVHGMVNGAKKYSMDDLKRFPSVSKFHFIECSGNGLTEWRQPTIIQSRCQDETGYVQPTIQELVDARGLDGGKFGSIYHLNGIQSWGIAADGGVTNVHQY